MDMLETLTHLSNEFGTDAFVRGGGGNTSCKDGRTMWIKPSGTTLAGMTPKAFVSMDRARLARLYDMQVPAEPTAREAMVKDAMAAAVKPETPGRASVEAPVHNAYEARYVVHTHPAWVNGLTCAIGGATTAATLFPDALWLPFIDPGYQLCLRVREELASYRSRNGREPRVMLLENHGVFVAGNTAEEIRATYGEVMEKLGQAYATAGVPANEPANEPAPAQDVAAAKERLRDAFGGEVTAVEGLAMTEWVTGPVTPDHIVYAKSYPYEGVLTAAALRAWKSRRGYAPRVVVGEGRVYGCGANAKVASLALVFALDGAHVRRLARAFGGVQYLSDAARRFIENWEVESYRAKQLDK